MGDSSDNEEITESQTIEEKSISEETSEDKNKTNI